MPLISKENRTVKIASLIDLKSALEKSGHNVVSWSSMDVATSAQADVEFSLPDQS